MLLLLLLSCNCCLHEFTELIIIKPYTTYYISSRIRMTHLMAEKLIPNLCSFSLPRFSQAQHVNRRRRRIITFYRDTSAVPRHSAILHDTWMQLRKHSFSFSHVTLISMLIDVFMVLLLGKFTKVRKRIFKFKN